MRTENWLSLSIKKYIHFGFFNVYINRCVKQERAYRVQLENILLQPGSKVLR